MAQPAAKRGDRILGFDTHNVVTPSGATVPVPFHPFAGVIDDVLSGNVTVDGAPAATVDSTSTNTPPHIAIGGTFPPPGPSDQATIVTGSATVLINGKAAARNLDKADTCNENPLLQPAGTVIAMSTVVIGG